VLSLTGALSGTCQTTGCGSARSPCGRPMPGPGRCRRPWGPAAVLGDGLRHLGGQLGESGVDLAHHGDELTPTCLRRDGAFDDPMDPAQPRGVLDSPLGHARPDPTGSSGIGGSADTYALSACSFAGDGVGRPDGCRVRALRGWCPAAAPGWCCRERWRRLPGCAAAARCGRTTRGTSCYADTAAGSGGSSAGGPDPGPGGCARPCPDRSGPVSSPFLSPARRRCPPRPTTVQQPALAETVEHRPVQPRPHNPMVRTNTMPANTPRSDSRGRPIRTRRARGLGISGSTSFHSSSLINRSA
jgi:hypothetical protein